MCVEKLPFAEFHWWAGDGKYRVPATPEEATSCVIMAGGFTVEIALPSGRRDVEQIRLMLDSAFRCGGRTKLAELREFLGIRA